MTIRLVYSYFLYTQPVTVILRKGLIKFLVLNSYSEENFFS